MPEPDRPGAKPLQLSPLLLQVEKALLGIEEPVYLVGGAVRDAFLGLPHSDLDFVVAQGGIKLAFHVADTLGLPAYVLDRERDVGRVVLSDGQTTLDFARMRGPDLEADLQDRDFTFNAMGLPIGAGGARDIIDPWGGREDLVSGWVRQTHPRAIADDPVRALRAIRMAISFELRLTAETEVAILAIGDGFRRISPERVRDELIKLLMTGKPDLALALMHRLELLDVLLPEVAAAAGVSQSPPHFTDVLTHTGNVLHWLTQVEAVIFDESHSGEQVIIQAGAALAPYRQVLAGHLRRRVVGGLEGRALLRLGALFHDVGKPETRTVDDAGRIRFFDHEDAGAKLTHRRLKRLHLSNEACQAVRTIVAGHMRPLHLASAPRVTSRAAYRYFRKTGPLGLEIALLSLADCLGTFQEPAKSPTWPILLERVVWLFGLYFNHYSENVAPSPLIDGHELIKALQLTPGPEVGRLLRIIQEAQAVGEVRTTAEALELARRSRSAS